MTNTTRRTALMGAIAVPLAASAAALPAMASEPDPIFEVIEAHKRAYQAFDETIDALMAAEERYAGQFGSNSPSVVLMTRAEWDATVIGHPWPFGDHDAKRLSSGEDIDRHTAGPAGKHSSATGFVPK